MKDKDLHKLLSDALDIQHSAMPLHQQRLKRALLKHDYHQQTLRSRFLQRLAHIINLGGIYTMPRSKKLLGAGGLLASVAVIVVLAVSVIGRPSPASAAQMLLDKVQYNSSQPSDEEQRKVDAMYGDTKLWVLLEQARESKNLTLISKEEFIKEFAHPLEYKTDATEQALQLAVKFLRFTGPKDVHIGMAIDAHDLLLFTLFDDVRHADDRFKGSAGWEVPQWIEKFGDDVGGAAKKVPFTTYVMENPEVNGRPIDPTDIMLSKAHILGKSPQQPGFALSTFYRLGSIGSYYGVTQSTANSEPKPESEENPALPGGLKPWSEIEFASFLFLRKEGEEVSIQFNGQMVKAYYKSTKDDQGYLGQTLVWMNDGFVYRIFTSGAYNGTDMTKEVLLRLPSQLKPYSQ